MRLRYTKLLALALALVICAGRTAAPQEGKAADANTVSAGEALFNKRCSQCHSLAEGKNVNGPSLFGIVDRAAAIEPGFKYSRALRQMAAKDSLAWNKDTLTTFLAGPSRLVPGTRMAFPGVSDEKDLAALVEWITANSGPPATGQ